MKRDLDLIRKLVLAAEEYPPPGGILDVIDVEGYTPAQIGYHSYLVVDAGLAKGIDTTTLGDTQPNWMILHLTSAGHDFADAARNDSIWSKGKSIVAEKAGAVTLDVMKQLLVGLLKKALDL